MENKILTSLPTKRGIGINTGKLVTDWKSINNLKVKVSFENNEYDLFIKGLSEDRNGVYVSTFKKDNQYDESDFKKIDIPHFKKGEIGSIVKSRFKYRFNNGDICDASEKGAFVKTYDYLLIARSSLLDKAGGSSTYDSSLLGTQISDLAKDINDEEDHLEDIEDAYYKKFTAMESYISKMNSQSSWLSQQFSS
jgi:flagellar capping protein FliD